jgi:sulfatase modifying factor 1
VIGKIASWFLVSGAIASACSRSATPTGGLMVEMDIDSMSALVASNLTRLDVAVSDATKTYRDAGYAIGNADPAAPLHVKFPTSLFIKSNGDPKASVDIALGLWDSTGEVDARSFRVTDIPTQRVAVLKVVFDAHPCASPTVDGAALPTYGEDAGAAACTAIDAGFSEASGADAGDGGPGDATVEDAADTASMEATASDASGVDAPDAVPIAPIPPCHPVCSEGQTHCVDGKCAPVPASCVDAGAGAGFNCGGPNGTDDCCASLDVPLEAQGAFLRDYDGVGGHLSPDFPATVTRFRLDVYEVTVGRFRKFANAASSEDGSVPWVPPRGSGKHAHLNGTQGLVNGGDAGTVYEPGWDPSWDAYLPTSTSGWDSSLLQDFCNSDASMRSNTWTKSAGPNENLPIDCVTWYQAYAFCIWDGGFLPSSTEWNFAASGGNNQWVFAWGDNLFSQDYAIYNCYYGSPPFGNNCNGLASIAPVGSAPKGRGFWGQLDLNGSMYEWTLDYGGFYPNPCNDCANFTTGNLRILRGGGFDSQPNEIETAFRDSSDPLRPHGDVGFRCARVP